MAPQSPRGDLVLDASAPLINVTLGGVAMRLRVDPAQWDVIELNGDAAAKLKPAWTGKRDIQVGRITIPGRSGPAVLVVGSTRLPVTIAEHGRTAITGADGIVGPDVLPFATIRWRNPAAPPPTGSIVLPLESSEVTGLAAPLEALPVRLHLTLLRDLSEATAAAGSLLARRYGGRFEGDDIRLTVMFGITRPARPMRFDAPPLLAGFRVASLPVRITDFRGDNPLPADRAAPGEIVVAGKDHPMAPQSWVTLARDRLGACAEIAYRAALRTITLTCAFDR